MGTNRRLSLATKLRHRLRETKVQEVIAGGMHDYIDSLQSDFNEIGNAMNLDYFHAATPK